MHVHLSLLGIQNEAGLEGGSPSWIDHEAYEYNGLCSHPCIQEGIRGDGISIEKLICQRATASEKQKLYKATPAGQQSYKKWLASARNRATDAYKVARKKYGSSPKGKEAQRRHRATDKTKAT
jgi:hypothetical protein